MAVLFGIHVFVLCLWSYILYVFQKWNTLNLQERMLARLNLENRIDSDKWVDVRVHHVMIDSEIKLLRKQIDMIIEKCEITL